MTARTSEIANLFKIKAFFGLKQGCELSNALSDLRNVALPPCSIYANVGNLT